MDTIDEPGEVPFEGYAAAHADARFTEWLRERSEPEWIEATTHRFTRELGSGTLDDEVFRRYLTQDYAFVETLVGAFGHAVGEAPTMDAKSRLVDFLAVLTDDENDYFERSFRALGVSEAEYRDPALTPTTRAFEDLLERGAREGGYAETLAVLVPAEWIYLEWASAVAEEPPPQFYFAEWIDLHADDAFESFVYWLRGELDREGKAASTRRRRRLGRLFRRTVELEVAFFESAYDPEETIPGGGERW
jgi:thiaminase/transcriptional activator TenA